MPMQSEKGGVTLRIANTDLVELLDKRSFRIEFTIRRRSPGVIACSRFRLGAWCFTALNHGHDDIQQCNLGPEERFVDFVVQLVWCDVDVHLGPDSPAINVILRIKSRNGYRCLAFQYRPNERTPTAPLWQVTGVQHDTVRVRISDTFRNKLCARNQEKNVTGYQLVLIM